MATFTISPKKCALFFILFASVAVPICIWFRSFSNPLLWVHVTNHPNMDDLKTVFKAASIGRTVIISMANKAYIEGHITMFDLFLQGFKEGENTQWLRKHLLIFTVDQDIFNHCNNVGLHCYRLAMNDKEDFGGEKLYMSKDFVEMMWRRTFFLGEVLKLGYNFIFTDMDIMWLRNPFLNLGQHEDEDLQISCDRFNGDPYSEANNINTGFYFIRSNNKTITLLDTWYAMKNNSHGMKEQDVLQMMIRRGGFKQLGVKVRFLDTLYFSGFCEDSKDFQAVATVHANCCRSIKAKVIDLMAVLEDWKKVKDLVKDFTNGTLTFRWSNHKACKRSTLTFRWSNHKASM